MVSSTAIGGVGVFVAACAAFYQLFLYDVLYTTLGFGRSMEDLHVFNAKCQKIDNLGLEACEDMLLHEPSGLLYLSCGNTTARTQWLPAVDHLNGKGRGKSDRMAILDTRGSGPIASRLKWMEPINFAGEDGTGRLDLHGFDISFGQGSTPTIKLLLINHRAPIDPATGVVLDATKTGANSTIELFESQLGDVQMRHVKTYFDPIIQTPNRLTFTGDKSGSFYFTNDHSAKVGLGRTLGTFKDGGNVAYCGNSGCKVANADHLTYPNGLIRGDDGLIYVPSSITGQLWVMEPRTDNSLVKVKTLQLPYPMDNLSKDGKGDIYAAAFPRMIDFIKSTSDPHNVFPPAAAFRISKSGTEYEFKKVLEGSGDVLPSTTTVCHDSQTGRLYLGGALAPFISICETR